MTMAFSAVPAPLYVLYAARDGFGPLMVTVIFAAYAAGVMASLFLAGHLSDWMGRRRMAAIAVAVNLVSGVVFLTWPTVPGLLIARVISGLSIGMLTATATAYLSELDAAGHGGPTRRRAEITATAANLGGLGFGRWSPASCPSTSADPLQVPYLVFEALLLIGLAGLALVPETVARPLARPGYRPQRVSVPADQRPLFFAAGAAAAAGFALLGLFTSLAPSFIAGTLHDPSHALAGTATFAVFGAAAVAQLALGRATLRRQLALGMGLLLLGLALITVAVWTASLALLLIGGVLAGSGVGALFKGSVSTVLGIAPPAARGETLASLFLAAYVGLAVPVVALGVATELLSTRTAVSAFAVVLATVVALVSRPLLHRSGHAGNAAGQVGNVPSRTGNTAGNVAGEMGTRPGRGRPGWVAGRNSAADRIFLQLDRVETSDCVRGLMKYVNLGATGLRVSRICLGMMSYANNSERPWVLDEDAAEPIVRAAAEGGVNFYDTADVYSAGASETATGRLLGKLFSREEVVVATKVHGPTMPGQNGRGLSRKHIMASIDASLARLDMDYVDLYQIHRWDPGTPIEETMAALHDVVKAGKARYVGASSMFAWQFAKAQYTASAHGWTRFVSMQDYYNLVYREEEREMIRSARPGRRRDPWSPLARGLAGLGNRTRDGGQHTTRANRRRVRRRHCTDGRGTTTSRTARPRSRRTEAGCRPPRSALAWLLHRPGVTAPIWAPPRLGHIQDALAAEQFGAERGRDASASRSYTCRTRSPAICPTLAWRLRAGPGILGGRP